MIACAVCPSDIKMARSGHRDLLYPRILGHEAVGEVVESDSSRIRVGDRVQVWPGIACGSCPSCKKGRDNLCENQGIIGFNADGGFAEFMAVPSQTVQRGGLNVLPDSVDPVAATLAEPLGCCVHGQESVNVRNGDRVVVFGAGPVGLMHAALSRLSGAETMVVEPIEKRRAMAFRMGASIVIPPQNVVKEIRDWSDGNCADVAILATPQVKIDSDLLGMMAPGGRICAFSGLPRSDPEVGFDINTLHYRELQIVGAYGCTSASNARALSLISDGSVDLSPLIDGFYPLSKLEEAFQAIEGRRALKCAITEFSR